MESKDKDVKIRVGNVYPEVSVLHPSVGWEWVFLAPLLTWDVEFRGGCAYHVDLLLQETSRPRRMLGVQPVAIRPVGLVA